MNENDLGCRAATSRFVHVNGLRLHLLEWGQPGKPALCFLHGGSAHAHWFDMVVPAFMDRFHVISLDQRGHGESQWARPPAYATENFADDLLKVMDAMGWAQATIAGHSMGGHNAMAFSAWHPERVRALVIVDSRPSFSADRLEMMHSRGQRGPRPHTSIEAAVDAFRLRPRDTVADPTLLRHLARVGVMERDGAWVYRFDPGTSAMRKPVDNWLLVDRITAPTLIARAEFSPNLPLEVVTRLASAIRNATVVTIPGAYHHVTLDRPREFVEALDQFMGGLERAPQAPRARSAPA